jgi:manganese transport protein
VNKPLQIALGILAAIGGFVDIGDIVFATTSGATFGYELLWATVVGVVGIIVYSEMCGRVATVAKRPVFDVVRERMGFGFGLATLVSSQVVNLMTLAAEVGGVALALQLLLGLPYRGLVLVALVMLVLVSWFLPFEWIERVYGFGGLLLIAFTVAALKLAPDWHLLLSGLVPDLPSDGTELIWAYFVVGLVSAALMPYEVYFYSSGVVEEGWDPHNDLSLNRLNSVVGFGLGAFLSMSLTVVAAQLFLPRGIEPEFLGTVGLATLAPLGQLGLLLGLIGIFFAVSGAAIDTCFSGAYNLAQFFGWEWGKYRGPRGAPRFTLTWMAFLGLGFLIIITGVNPLYVTELAVVFSVVAMPLTYVPILLVARDHGYMGEYANGRLGNALGWTYFGVIAIIALSAVPLLVLTNLGQG